MGHLPPQRIGDGLRRVARYDEALVGEPVDQGGDAARSVLAQEFGERVAQFGAAQDSGVVHVVTMARRSDIADGLGDPVGARIRSEAGKSKGRRSAGSQTGTANQASRLARSRST
jgi:hypothetical protein